MHSCVSEQPQGGRPHMHFSLPQGIFSELEELEGSNAASCARMQE